MRVGDSAGDSLPLYMSTVLDILRKYQKRGGLPEFKEFKDSMLSSKENDELSGGGYGGRGGGRGGYGGGRGGRGGGYVVGAPPGTNTSAPKFTDKQIGPLELRIKLLESLIEESDENKHFSRYNLADVFSDKESLVIVDLTDPMMSAPEANGVFQVLLSKFITSDLGGCGKMIVLDEAHKYISPSANDELALVKSFCR